MNCLSFVLLCGFVCPWWWPTVCPQCQPTQCITVHGIKSQCITVHHTALQCIAEYHSASHCNTQCIAENHIVLQFVTPCSNACPQCQPTHSQEPTTVHHSKPQCIAANHIMNNINGMHQCIKGTSQCTTVPLSDSHCKPECHPLSASLSCCDSPAPSSLTSQGQKAKE